MTNFTDFRRGLIEGAAAVYESVALRLSPPAVREVEAWLLDLENWVEGPMPKPPFDW